MYNLDILLRLKENNISINMYILLKIIEDCSLSFFKEDNIELIVNLKMDGYLTSELELTKKATDLLGILEDKKESKIVNNESLYAKLKEELFKLTGRKQYMVSGSYAFIPNFTDFNIKLKQTIVKYKLKDLSKVESLLLLHIQKAVKANFKYVTLIGYYISKDNKSQLATDYDNYEENEKEITVNKPIDTFNI